MDTHARTHSQICAKIFHLNRTYNIASFQNGTSVKVAELRYGRYIALMPMPFRPNEPLPDDSSPWAGKWTKNPLPIENQTRDLTQCIVPPLFFFYENDQIIVVQNMRWSGASGIVFGSFCIIGLAMTLGTAIFVLYHRNHIVIVASR